MDGAGAPPPPGGKRERTKAENRRAILAAARRVFADLGYEATTVRDVIRETELAAGTFYNYFRDKESVLRALLDEKMAEMQARAKEARRDAHTVEDIVRRTLGVSFAMLLEDRAVFDLLRRNAGAIRAILDDPSFVANRDELRRDLERALRRGGVKGVDAEYLTAAISGLSFEVAAAAADRPPDKMTAAAEFAVRLIVGGLPGLGIATAREQAPDARRVAGPRGSAARQGIPLASTVSLPRRSRAKTRPAEGAAGKAVRPRAAAKSRTPR
ncbi:MAG: TetR/AcrR family transcriptional regulator [Candidatus Binatia bacterium]